MLTYTLLRLSHFAQKYMHSGCISTFHKESLEPYVCVARVNDGLREIYIIIMVVNGESKKRRVIGKRGDAERKGEERLARCNLQVPL